MRVASSSPSASRASRSTRPPAATRSATTSRCWRPTSRPIRRCPGSSRPSSGALGDAQPLPRPVERAAAPRAERPLRRPAVRIAIGNGSCDILLAAGEALLEPGAELVYAWPSFCVYPHLAAASGARAITVPLDDERPHDLDAMAREITVATRLVIVCNPNNPTSHGAAARRDRGVPRAGAAPRLRDPRRGLLRVQHARRPRRVARPARAPPQPRAAADVLQGLRPVRAARRLRAVRRRATSRSAVDQVRQPFFCNALAAGGRDRGAAPPGRGHRARRAHGRRAPGGRGAACASWGSSPPTRRRTSAGSTCPGGDGRGRSRLAASPSAACSCARAARSGAPGALRVTYGTPRRTTASSTRCASCCSDRAATP